MSPRSVRAFGAIASLVVALGGGNARGMDITACGQTVPKGDAGILQTDLVGCGAHLNDAAVSLEDAATLQMNGHSISGGFMGVSCPGRRCAVMGPGDIASGSIGIDQEVEARGLQRAFLQDLNLHDLPYGAIGASSSRHAPMDGPVESISVAVRDLYATNVTVEDNVGWGIFAIRTVKASGLVVTGNGTLGLTAVRVRLSDSTLTGNGGTQTGVDFTSLRRPRLVNTSCGRGGGRDGELAAAWGVCANDPAP